MAAEEGQVIGCHTNDVWTVQLQKAKESNKLIVIDFTASWCPPCRMIAPIFADLAKKFMASAICFKVDVDELQNVAQEYGVEACRPLCSLKAVKFWRNSLVQRKKIFWRQYPNILVLLMLKWFRSIIIKSNTNRNEDIVDGHE